MTSWQVINTDELPQQDRFGIWHDAFCGVHDVEADTDTRDDFRASSRNIVARDTVFGIYEAPARTLSRTDRHIVRQALDHWVVRVPLSCSIRGTHRGQCYDIGAGGVGLGTLAHGYVEVHTGGASFAAVLPRSTLPSLRDDQVRCSLDGFRANLLRDFVFSFVNSLSAASFQDILVFEEVFRSILVSMLTDSRSAVVSDCLQLRRVDEVIRSEMHSARLSVERICELSGLSRSTLYRLFKPRGGVEQHLTGLRLELIRKDLQDLALCTQPISRLAERRGMHNASAFNRAFQRRFGCTPGEVRNSALRGQAQAAERTLVQDAPGSFLQLLR